MSIVLRCIENTEYDGVRYQAGEKYEFDLPQIEVATALFQSNHFVLLEEDG